MTNNTTIIIFALFLSLCFFSAIQSVKNPSHHFPNRTNTDDNQISPRIIGGYWIGNDSLFYQLHVSYNMEVICGATLVEVYAIHIALTASHCVWLGYPRRDSVVDPKKLIVTAGDRKLNDTDKIREQRRKVTKVVSHPNYDAQYFTDDIAILFLKKDFADTDYVGPIDLPGHDWAQPSSVRVSGWGSESFAEDMQNELSWVQIATVGLDECKKFNKYPWMKITDNDLCVGELGGTTLRSDPCHGDSGGPGIGQNDTTDEFYLAGVVSHGLTAICGNPHAPTIFTWVPKYMDWIRIEVSKYREENGI